jgi:phosphoglucosamine mutase
MRKLFGTDGMRGVAGQPPLDPATTFAVGVALGKWIGQHHLDPEVVIGMDTRESGPVIAAHVAGGLEKSGVRARFAGLITTPGIAHVTRTGPFAAGVMISASHNPYLDNGIKIIDHSGFKLPDEQEHEIEKDIFAWLERGEAPVPTALTTDHGLDQAYIDALAATMPARLDRMERRRTWRRLYLSGWERRSIAFTARPMVRTSICTADRSIWRACASR